MNTQDFLIWEQVTRDTIDFKKVYVDVTEDLIGGLLLSQIVYWNLPGQMGKTKLRVKIDDELWLAKGREEWWEECRISAKQFDRAIKILEAKGIVTTMIKKFNGFPTKHIKLNLDVLVQKLTGQLKTEGLVEFTQRVKRNFPKGKNGFSPKGKKEFPQKVKSITENTTKIKKTETNNNNKEEKIKTTFKSQNGNVVVNEVEIKDVKEIIHNYLDITLDNKDIENIIITLKAKFGFIDAQKLIGVVNILKSNKNEIQNITGYIITAIAKDYKLNQYSNASSSNTGSLGFKNFDERKYDYDDLERKLLGWD